MSVHKAYVFRLYPTTKQAVALGQMTAAHAEVYNAALQERRDAWRQCRVSVKAGMQMAQLTEMRAARPDQARWSFTSQQQTLRRVDKAFQAFYRRVQAGQADIHVRSGSVGYPRFKAARRFDSVDFRHGDGIKWIDLGRAAHARLRIQGVGHVDVRMHRRLPEAAVLGQVTVKREGSGPRAKWFVVLPVEYAAPETPTPTCREIGVDVGVNHLASLTEPVPGLTDGDGHIANPRHYRAAQAKLACAQQALSRCKRGSNRRKLARNKVAAVHARVRRTRLDYLHKTARALVDYADLIAVEDIPTANLVRAPRPVPAAPLGSTEAPGQWLPNGAAAKAGLNKSILDAGWSTLLALLNAKAEEAGRLVVRVDPAYTSRDCSACGQRKTDLQLAERSYACVHCGLVLDRDTNAARNILRAGTARRAAAQAA